MNGPRAAIARARSAERVTPDRLRFHFDVSWEDGRKARVTALANRHGLVLDLQADGPGGFVAGTSGDPAVDHAIREHVAGFARGSTPRRMVVQRGRRS